VGPGPQEGGQGGGEAPGGMVGSVVACVVTRHGGRSQVFAWGGGLGRQATEWGRVYCSKGRPFVAVIFH